jgi:hypothetical protein
VNPSQYLAPTRSDHRSKDNFRQPLYPAELQAVEAKNADVRKTRRKIKRNERMAKSCLIESGLGQQRAMGRRISLASIRQSSQVSSLNSLRRVKLGQKVKVMSNHKPG